MISRLGWTLLALGVAAVKAIVDRAGEALEPYAFENTEPDPEPDRVVAEHFLLWDRELWS